MVSAIKVFYTPRMVADSHCMSPSAARPAPVVESWQQLGVPLEIVAPKPVTQKQIALAHDPEFVRKVLAGEEYNGLRVGSVQRIGRQSYSASMEKGD